MSEDRSWNEAYPAVGVYVDEGALREEFAHLTTPEPRWPRIHLFRLPRLRLFHWWPRRKG